MYKVVGNNLDSSHHLAKCRSIHSHSPSNTMKMQIYSEKMKMLSQPEFPRRMCLPCPSYPTLTYKCRHAETASAPSETGDDVLSEQERKKRRAMEYEEDEDAPLPSKAPGVETNYTLANLGVPRSSDGDVCTILLLWCTGTDGM